MSIKRLIGFVLMIGGVVLILIALHAMHKIAEAKSLSQDINNFFTHNPTWNPIIKFFGGKAQEKISAYDTQALLTLFSGILLTIVGAVMAIIHRKRY